jgi:DNA-binding IclR family transcriptional regulator
MFDTMAGRDDNDLPSGGGSGHTPLLVLGKITEILNAFTLRRPSLTLRDIQQATGIPSSTVQRLVTNLVAHGFLDRVDDRFRIGVKMAYWAAAAAKELDVLAVVNPVLKDLRDVTGETACFFRVEGEHRVCIAVADTHHGLRRDMPVGRIAPLSVGASGRVLLAWNADLAEQVLGHELPQLTDSTVTNRDELRRLIKQTAADGYAITVGERVDSASGIAAPVFDSAADLVGAVVVQGPTLRMPYEKCVEWVDVVVEHAERITRALGGRFPD